MQKTDAGSSTHRADKKGSIRGTDIRCRALGRKLLIVGAGLCSVVSIMLAVNIFGADPAIREMLEQNATVNMLSWTNEPGYTFSWIFAHPLQYMLMCVRTCIKMADYYFFTMMGSSLGWLDVSIPMTYSVVSFVLFMLAVNIRDDASALVHISMAKKIWILVLGAGSMLITMLAMTLNWTPASYDYVIGVQGRYFIPLLIPMIWVFRNNVIHIQSIIRKYIVLFTVLMNVWILVYVFSRNIVGLSFIT